jgi:hypothetical protein
MSQSNKQQHQHARRVVHASATTAAGMAAERTIVAARGRETKLATTAARRLEDGSEADARTLESGAPARPSR